MGRRATKLPSVHSVRHLRDFARQLRLAVATLLRGRLIDSEQHQRLDALNNPWRPANYVA